MAFSICEDRTKELILLKFSGDVDNDEIMRVMTKLYQLESHPISDQMIDFSAVRHFLVTPDGVTTYTETAMERRDFVAADSKRKIVVYAPTDLVFGMSRLISAVAARSGVDMMVFRELDQVLDYLDLEQNYADSLEIVDSSD